MSNEEKLRRDRHQRIRRIWSIILMVEIALCAVMLAALIYVNHKSSELIYVNYTETPKTEYEVLLDNKEFWETVEPGSLYEAANIKEINANFSYETAIESKNIQYSYEYNIVKYIIFSKDRGSSKFDPMYLSNDDQIIYNEDERFIKSESGVLENTNKLTLTDKLSFSYQNANKIAVEFLERLKDDSVDAHLYVEMNITVKSSCDDFLTENTETATYKLKTQLVSEGATHVEDLTDAASGGQTVACTRAGDVAVATEKAILPTGIALVVSILVLILFLQLTKNKDVTYANTIKGILRSYKSYIQVSTSKFTSNGFVVYRIGSITEMLEIRDTVQKPVIMIENEDRTCSKFFIVDGEVMYLFGICVEGFEELLYDNNPTQTVVYVEPAHVEEAPVVEETPVVIEPVVALEPVVVTEEVKVEEPQEEQEKESTLEESEEDDEETVKLLKMCSYTFEAKLILAEPEMKEFYREIAEFALSYGVKVVRSAKRERIYLGRKLFANLTFSGKKLVVAMALNPNDYVDSKYKFKDMSETKKFAETPFVMKVTSGLKVRHIKELLTTMFEAEGIVNKNLDIKIKKIPTRSKKSLIKDGLIKINERKINN